MTTFPLSVLMVLDQLAPAGTETHVLSLTKSLIQRGHRVALVSSDGELRSSFEQVGCTVYLLDSPEGGSTNNLGWIEKLQNIMKMGNFDCVHAHQTPSGLLAAEAANSEGIPLIFTTHGTYYPKDSLGSLLSQSKAVISVSKPVQQYVDHIGYPSYVIPNGIDLGEFYPSSQHTKVRSELGISESSILIVYASRLAWGKATACDILLRAMKDLHRYGWLQFELVVVGDGPKRDAIQRLADFIHKECGRTFIHLAGQQTHMHDYYNAADIVVGTGRVALEALATEKPVLAIGNNGFFGWVEPDNYEDAWSLYFGDHGSNAPHSRYLFADQIVRGYQRLEVLKAQGQANRRWVEHLFHSERNTDQLIHIYQSVSRLSRERGQL
ncbi:glycosyltransferase family 4 protein [Paenibacillus qinlingensis]|uniref:Glycosyltransferase involved in cell wall biosynthesis n=1 Tax=Paenibacillus qinlingensis TaxID=1837343 RepID=A0ABU1NT87_9BACL|nr:glycosyltransferase family 4 protein [Paenibacillus qinlingensis]MDR6550266.1 glycosyltransferase involved in cell wall biosynthesis [Paenibacillus qinlingensis]